MPLTLAPVPPRVNCEGFGSLTASQELEVSRRNRFQGIEGKSEDPAPRRGILGDCSGSAPDGLFAFDECLYGSDTDVIQACIVEPQQHPPLTVAVVGGAQALEKVAKEAAVKTVGRIARNLAAGTTHY